MSVWDSLLEVRGEYRPILLLHLDFGKDDKTIRNWVDWCAGLGYGGVGLIISKDWDRPEMDQDWYDGLLTATESAVSQAEKHGLGVWIFDEWGYPSGTAAGLVCRTESYRSKKLHIAADYMLAPGESVTLQIPERLVSAGAIPLNKYTVYAPDGPCKPIPCSPGETLTYTAGNKCERVVIVTWEYLSFITHAARENRPDDYALGTIDLLNPEAARRFTEVMHEPYYKRLGKYFGSVIKGFFYDEPELCYEFPWTTGLEQTFIEKKGYDLREQLPILMSYIGAAYHPGWEGAHGLISKLTGDYRDVWTQAVADAFYGELEKWCHAHGILSVGHQDLDNHAETLCSVSGDFFRNSARNDHPGIDVIWDNIELGRFNDFPRYAGSCKRLLGKERAISETFAEMGVAHYPDRMRFVLEQQIIRGVDEFVLMISQLEPEDKLTLNCFSPGNMALERYGNFINTHVGRAAQLSQAGVSGARVAVYIPLDDIYRYQQAKRDGHTNNTKLPWDNIDAIARVLAYYPCDFQYIWEDALMTLPIENGALLLPGGQRLDTIILPPYMTLPESILERLKGFVRAGGRVVTMETPIFHDEGLFTFIPSLESLPEAISSPVIVSGGTIAMCHRLLDDGEAYMLLNEGGDAEVCLWFLDAMKGISRMDMLTGTLSAVDCDNGELRCYFGAGELKVFVSGARGSVAPAKPVLSRSLTITEFTVALPDGGIARLDGFLPDWAELGFPTWSGDVVYTGRFTLPPGNTREECRRISVSLGEVRYSAVVSLDGAPGVPLPFFPFVAEFDAAGGEEHTLTITVLNTRANAMIGTRETELANFGGRTPIYLNTDRKYLRSGLLGPVTVCY